MSSLKMSHDVGSAFNLEDAIFTRIGYTMDGWALSDGGAKEYDLEESVSFDEYVVEFNVKLIIKFVLECEAGHIIFFG